MSDIHETIEKYNPNKEHNVLIVFNDIISYMFCNENCNPKVSESFLLF